MRTTCTHIKQAEEIWTMGFYSPTGMTWSSSKPSPQKICFFKWETRLHLRPVVKTWWLVQYKNYISCLDIDSYNMLISEHR